MNGDLTDHRVAALNVHRILRRAAGDEGATSRVRDRALRDTPKGSSASRRPKQD